MDEIEYKLNSNNSVLVVNAIDKLITMIKSKFKPVERQRFVVENEELKFLREKCTSKEPLISQTACQGLLALVELGVLEIGHTMSTIVTLIPSTHNVSAIISTMSGLLILDLRSRIRPGQPYKCQFSMRSPQHPFITVLEKNREAEDDVVEEMYALCSHPDYVVFSNSTELLRPVFLWLASEGGRGARARVWPLLAGKPLLMECLACLQLSTAPSLERAQSLYSTAGEAGERARHAGPRAALMPALARLAWHLGRVGRDPRATYTGISRALSLETGDTRAAAGLTVALLADHLAHTPALYLHKLFNLCLTVISKYEHSSLSLNMFASLSLQWLHQPSYLTSSALKVASKILEMYRTQNEDNLMFTSNLNSNKTFQTFLYSDSHLNNIFKLFQTWERIRDNPDKIKKWLASIDTLSDDMKLEIVGFLIGVFMDYRKDAWFEEIAVKSLDIVVRLATNRKEVSVMLLPVLLYKIANDDSPAIKVECLKAVPLMAKTKENVPTIVSVLGKLKANKRVPMSFVILLYTKLAVTQVRCFPYLQETLSEASQREPRAEVDAARAQAVLTMCLARPEVHGLELVPTISSILNKCTDASGCAATDMALSALGALWEAGLVAPDSAWRAAKGRLAQDNRPRVQESICRLLSTLGTLVSGRGSGSAPEAAALLWRWLEAGPPPVAAAAALALASFRVDEYTLKEVPEVFHRNVLLPPSHCKTPIDAARKPEDVLDYIPSSVWPSVFLHCVHSAVMLGAAEALCARLVARELRAHRGWRTDGRTEFKMESLPDNSVLKGLWACLRKQATSPTYDWPEEAVLSILRCLSQEGPKPLPPLDLTFLHEVFHRGAQWKVGALRLAARQAQTTPSAARLLENYLEGVGRGGVEEPEILLIFELLPQLCRGLPPNSLRAPIERALDEAYGAVVSVQRKDQTPGRKDGDGGDENEEYLFIKLLQYLKQCLECERLHDANRTLIAQTVEKYFTIIPEDHVSWPQYILTTTSLPDSNIERMTSPSSWWEPSPGLLKAATAVCAERGLAGLSGLVGAQARERGVQEDCLKLMFPAMKKAKDDGSTVQWLLELMAEAQLAFKETEDISIRQYYTDVFALAVISFSGVWSFEPDSDQLALSRGLRLVVLPAAAAALAGRQAWSSAVYNLLQWLVHTRAATRGSVARGCHRALLMMRHTQEFVEHCMWNTLDFTETDDAAED